MRRLTELDKLECAEYFLDILKKALNRDGPFSTAHGLWMERAGQDMDKIRGQYLENVHRTPGGEL